jgi:hypothetical protein
MTQLPEDPIKSAPEAKEDKNDQQTGDQPVNETAKM